MEHIAAFMLLIACSHNMDSCESAIPAPYAYETMQDCEMDLGPEMVKYAAAGPEILGRCVQADPALSYDNATLEWDIAPSGELDVALIREDPAFDLPTYAANMNAPVQSAN